MGKLKSNPPWTCIDNTKDVDGLTGKYTRDIIFWNVDEFGKMIVVTIPKGVMPVVNFTGKS